jgi:dye decolorizing peroxidase
VLAFHGVHQAGIETAPAAWTQLLAFDVGSGVRRPGLRSLLQRWTGVAAALTTGAPAPGDTSPEIAAAGPAALSVTVGFGPGLFDRAGLDALRPEGLVQLPSFTHDALDPASSDGDVLVQVSGDDPLIVAHTAAGVVGLAAPDAHVRWTMRGFRRGDTVAAHRGGTASTTRNLMGQVDGTVNPVPGTTDFATVVWCADGVPAWLQGGSMLVLRRIAMLLPAWEKLSRAQQEQVIGRRKDTGAPLSGTRLTDVPDLSAQRADGGLVIAPDAHLRLAAPETNAGARIFRRPYSYDDGFDAAGNPDAGQLFVAWQADIRTGFLPIQQRLDAGDHLNDFTQAQASAVFAAPAGVAPGGYLGQELIES